MGTFSPSPFYTTEVDEYCKENIYKPTMAAMKKERRDFVGILFFGLMLTEKGPQLLEYNARFGDPETQVVLPRLKNDIVEIFEACIDGTLKDIHLEFEDNAAVCVILASEGYPNEYTKGYEIEGLDHFKEKEGYYAFHSGTMKTPEGIVTNGGRVLGITATGTNLLKARENAYKATEWVTFENKYMRGDIGRAIEEM
jgi:phosphoribosylamine--glycine ligase